MTEWKKLALIAVISGAFGILTLNNIACAQEAAAPAVKADSAIDEDADIENLVSVQGEVSAVDPKANTVTVKDPNVKDSAAAIKTLTIDPKTTTIWGEYDEIKLSDLPVGSKVAGEYKQNTNGSLTATYLEIVLDEEAELPPLDESPDQAKSKAAEKPVE